MWKSGELSHLEVRKTENGFIVLTGTVGPIVQPESSGRVKVEREQICKSYPEVLELLAAYFAWDTSEAVNPKFPSTFVRFDIDGTYVTAVFREWGVECRRTVDGLDMYIEWLGGTIQLMPDELEPWYAVLAELRVKSAAAVAKEGAGI
jgi:hypothetical protein